MKVIVRLVDWMLLKPCYNQNYQVLLRAFAFPEETVLAFLFAL